MTPKFSLITVIAGAALVLAVPAWGKGQAPASYPDVVERAVAAKLALQSQPLEIVRDHGDATQAKLAAQPSPLVIVRDHGDATQAKLTAQSSPLVIVRDHGDATQAKLAQLSAASVTTERIGRAQAGHFNPVASDVEVSKVDSRREIEWPQVGLGLGIGILLALGLGLIMRAVNVRPFAH